MTGMMINQYAQQGANPDTQQALTPNIQQALANLGVSAEVADIANKMPETQLQGILANSQPWQDEFQVAQQPNFAFSMPLAAQMPFNNMAPSTAFGASATMMSPSYYAGPMPNMTMSQTLGQMQTQFPLSQRYLQQGLNQPGVMQNIQQYYNTPGMMPGMGGTPMPGGPMGGLAGLSNPGVSPQGMPGVQNSNLAGANVPGVQNSNLAGAGNLSEEENRSLQDSLIQQKMTNFNEAVTLWSKIASSEDNLRMSIIQNIR